MIKAVVFDLWSTLTYNNSEKNIIQLIFEKIGIKEYDWETHNKMVKSFMLKRYKSAEDGMKDFCRAFGKDEKLAKELAKLWGIENIKIKFFDDVLPALMELRKKYKLGLISNTQSFEMGFFYKNKFFDKFDFVCLSFEVGMIKPNNPEMFKLMLERLGVKPEEAVMVGDNLRDDVLAAESIGMKGILIKRQGKVLGWKEKANWKRTITSLDELKKFL